MPFNCMEMRTLATACDGLIAQAFFEMVDHFRSPSSDFSLLCIAAMASNLIAMASNLPVMASNPTAHDVHCCAPMSFHWISFSQLAFVAIVTRFQFLQL